MQFRTTTAHREATAQTSVFRLVVDLHHLLYTASRICAANPQRIEVMEFEHNAARQPARQAH